MILKSEDGIIDCDIGFLDEALAILDARLRPRTRHIQTEKNARDLGLCDLGEHIIGLGFVACQKYFSSTYGCTKIEKRSALSLGPLHAETISAVEIINAVANYWKHNDEWDSMGLLGELESEWMRVMPHIRTNLSKQARYTVNTIERATPLADYTCANALASLIGDREFELRSLTPIIVEWRNEFARILSG